LIFLLPLSDASHKHSFRNSINVDFPSFFPQIFMSRKPLNQLKLQSFISEFLRESTGKGNIYLSGGACAVIYGWRSSTIDIDLKADPEPDSFYRILQDLKNRLEVNLEIASPDLFVPALPGWQTRSIWIAGSKEVNFYHYDFYSQALAKLSRGHPRDLIDVDGMIRSQLMTRPRLFELFQDAIPLLERYPALDQETLIRTVTRFCSTDESCS
jgi:hypothetical protein